MSVIGLALIDSQAAITFVFYRHHFSSAELTGRAAAWLYVHFHNELIDVGSIQLLFSPSVSISKEGSVGSATGASTNTLKMRDHSLEVRRNHPATIFVPISSNFQPLADKTWVNKNTANEYAYT